MPFPAPVDQATADILIGQLALLFLAAAGNDMDAARHVAAKMLESHHPQNDDELAIAAQIVGLGARSMDALCQSANPGLTEKAQAQLTGRGIALHREAHKSRRTLATLRRDHAAKQPAAPAEQAAQPATEKAVELIERACEAIEAAGKGQGKALAQDLRKRQLVQQMNENSRREREKYEAEQAAKAQAA